MKSLSVPFSISNGRVASTTSFAKATEGKILTTLVTSPGERIALPPFGAAIYSLLFESMDELMMSDFVVDAKQEVNSRVSSVNIINISITPDTSLGDNVAKVAVLYQLPLSNPQVVTYRVVVPTTLTNESIF